MNLQPVNEKLIFVQDFWRVGTKIKKIRESEEDPLQEIFGKHFRR